jgi:hypothetical protein
MVSTAPERFGDPEEAYDTIREKRGIGNLIRNLKRTVGVEIIDWVVILEWYTNGYPHFHLFIEVRQQGGKGMIGVDNIKKYWPYALWVTEDYIKDQQHWNNLTGYFEKHGYFSKDKEHQGKLPEWALQSRHRIKRWISKKNPKGDPGSISDNDDDGDSDERRTYQVILEQCGKHSQIELVTQYFIDGELYAESGRRYTYKIPYDLLKKMFPWRYVEHCGLVMDFVNEEWMEKFFIRVTQIQIDLESGKKVSYDPPN